MKINLNHISKISLILTFIFLLAGLFLIKFNDTFIINGITNVKKTFEPVKQPVEPPVKINIPKQNAKESQLQIHFKSNEEMKKTYGRLEIVYLFDGREYTGVVLAVDSSYSIITIEGLKKIPMKEVKMRVLLE